MVKKEIKAKMQELPSLDSPRSIVVPQQTEPDLIPYEAEEDDRVEISDLYKSRREVKTLCEQISLYWNSLDDEVAVEELVPFFGIAYAARAIKIKEIDQHVRALLHSYNSSLGMDRHEITRRLNEVEGALQYPYRGQGNDCVEAAAVLQVMVVVANQMNHK